MGSRPVVGIPATLEQNATSAVSALGLLRLQPILRQFAVQRFAIETKNPRRQGFIAPDRCQHMVNVPTLHLFHGDQLGGVLASDEEVRRVVVRILSGRSSTTIRS